MRKKTKEEQYILNTNRSKLSNAAFIKWIRSRYQNNDRSHKKYLYFPQQLIKETSIEKIFVEFDSDKSGGLSRNQVFDMFNDFGIKITMDHLNELYDSVQVDLKQLDCEKFKKCALSEDSNRVFRKIVEELGNGYYPHNFVKMIIYIEIKNTLNEPTQKIDIKFDTMEKLLRLNDLALNNERLVNHTLMFKQNIRNSFRDIWEGVNEKYNQKFPYIPKSEEQFFDYCHEKNLL